MSRKKEIVMFKAILASLLIAGACFANTVKSSEERVVVLTEDNSVNLRGPISSSVEGVAVKLLNLDAKRGNKGYPIYVVLDSPGGEIDAGNDFIEVTKSIKNLHTITLFAASMASAIQQAIPGERLMVASGISMFHRAAGGFQGQFEDGEVESRLGMAKDIVKNLELSNANRIGLSIPEYKAKVITEWWLVGSKAVTSNVADGIVTLKCSQSLLDKKEVVRMSNMFFSINFKFSGCPLLRSGNIDSKAELDIFNKFADRLDSVSKMYFKIK